MGGICVNVCSIEWRKKVERRCGGTKGGGIKFKRLFGVCAKKCGEGVYSGVKVT